MSESRISVTAKVTLTIEVSAPGSWGPEVNADQVYRQAKNAVLEMFRYEKMSLELRRSQIIGEPKVLAILVENAR